MARVARVRLEDNGRFLEEGLVARVELERTQQEFNEARRFLLDVARDQHALEANEIQFTHENATRILAQSFFRDGPVYSGRVALVPDPTTASGFAWTSANAAGQTLSAGTLASVEINSPKPTPDHAGHSLARGSNGIGTSRMSSGEGPFRGVATTQLDGYLRWFQQVGLVREASPRSCSAASMTPRCIRFAD